MNGIAVRCDHCQKIEFITNEQIHANQDLATSWLVPEGWFKLTSNNKKCKHLCSSQCVIDEVKKERK